MIAGAGWKPGNGRKIARRGLIADISRTITAGTPGDVRYIQYNTYYIEYNFLIWQTIQQQSQEADHQQQSQEADHQQQSQEADHQQREAPPAAPGS